MMQCPVSPATLVMAILAMGGAALAKYSVDEPPASGPAALATDWDALQKEMTERIELLRTLTDVQQQAHLTGALDFTEVTEAQRALSEAEYAYARVFGTTEERQVALKNSLAAAEELLKRTETQFRTGTTTHAAVLEARVGVTNARLAMLRDTLADGGPFPPAPR